MLIKMHEDYVLKSGFCYFINGQLYILLGVLLLDVIDLNLYKDKFSLVTSTGLPFDRTVSGSNEVLLFQKCVNKDMIYEDYIEHLNESDFSTEFTVIEKYKWRNFCQNNFVDLSTKYTCNYLVDSFASKKFIVKCLLAGKRIFRKLG